MAVTSLREVNWAHAVYNYTLKYPITFRKKDLNPYE